MGLRTRVRGRSRQLSSVSLFFSSAAAFSRRSRTCILSKVSLMGLGKLLTSVAGAPACCANAIGTNETQEIKRVNKPTETQFFHIGDRQPIVLLRNPKINPGLEIRMSDLRRAADWDV